MAGQKIEVTQTRALFCSLVNDTTLTDELEKKMDSIDKYFIMFGAIANE